MIPQGVSLNAVTPELIRTAGEKKLPGTIIVGYMAAFMLTGDDRDGGKALYNVDHLLDLWEEVRVRVPEARLWLVGGASDRVRERIGASEDIVVFGRLRARSGTGSHRELRHRPLPTRRATKGFRLQRPPSTWALASRRCRTTTP